MARRRRGIGKGQRTVTGDKAKEGPRLVRARFYKPDEEYEELSDTAISRIYNHLRQSHWESLKNVQNENQFFSAMARVSAQPKDRALQNISRKDADKIFSLHYQEIGWVEREKMKADRRDFYRGLIEQGKFGELNRIRGIRRYWHSVKSIAGKKKISISDARSIWRGRRDQKAYWKKQRE